MSSRPILFVVALLATAGSAYSQLKLPLHTDPRHPLTPIRSQKVKLGSPIDTRKLRPQIQTSLTDRPLMPENPTTPRWNEIAGVKNSLSVGGQLTMPRTMPRLYWPAISFTGWSPADPTLAVGPNNVVVTTNSSIAFYSKSGERQLQVDASTFFSGISITPFLFDPRVIFDAASQRWVIIFDEQDTTTNYSYMDFAVSANSDPNGVWTRFRLISSLTIDDQIYWLDYPSLAASRDELVVSGNLFPAAGMNFGGVEFIIVPKQAIFAGGLLTANSLSDPDAASVQLASCNDASVDRVFGVGKLNTSMVRLYTFSGSGTSYSLNYSSIAVPNFENPSQEAPSTPGQLDSTDGRMQNASWRSGRLLACHTVGGIGTGYNHVRWYDFNMPLDTSIDPSLLQSGELQELHPNQYHMGAIVRNGYSDVSAIFTRSGPSIPADLMCSGRFALDPLGTMGASTLLQSSAGPGYGSASVNRWGDYFQCVVDPVDDATFWGIGMVGDAEGNWQTVVHSWTVTPPAKVLSIALEPTIQGGSTATATLNLDAPAPERGYSISIASSNPVALSAPATVFVPGGVSVVSFSISAAEVLTDQPVILTATLRDGSVHAVTFIIAPKLTGIVSLGDFSGTQTGIPVVVTLRDPGNSADIATFLTSLDSQGHFSIEPGRTGVYDVTVKATHWLRKMISNVALDPTGGSISALLMNGDINGDNAVTLGDFAALRAAFGSTSGDPNWNPAADLNGDGAVSLGDFAILRARFGQAGDP